MQQTSKYQFNLVEGGDDFSPTPLNQNMEKVEDQFQAVEDQFDTVMENLGTVGHNARVVEGSYVGTGTYGVNNPNSLTFQMCPVLVMIVSTTYPTLSCPMILMRPAVMTTLTPGANGAKTVNLFWEDQAVEWYVGGGGSATDQANVQGQTYHYVAIGY